MTKSGACPRHSSAEGSTPRGRSEGFTLIELLIVIFIIGILISLLTVGIQVAKKKTKKATASSDVSKIVQALAGFNSDTGLFPAYRIEADESELETFNAFPHLYISLCRDKSNGGGPNGPYLELKVDMIGVRDYDSESGYTQARQSDLKDNDTEKFYFDPWNIPYIYRENSAKRKKRDWMIKPSKYDLWSCGPNEKNQSWNGLLDEEDYEIPNDDIGNW